MENRTPPDGQEPRFCIERWTEDDGGSVTEVAEVDTGGISCRCHTDDADWICAAFNAADAREKAGGLT